MKINLQKLVLLLAALVTASLFLKESLNSIAIILFCVSIVTLGLIGKDYSKIKGALYKSLPLLIYFVLALIGYFIGEQSNTDYLIRLSPFLISPIFIYGFLQYPNSKKHVIKAFVVSSILFLLFLDSLAIWDMIALKSLYVLQDGREYYRFIYTRFTQDYINHIYLSTYILMSVCLLLQYKILKNKVLKSLLLLFFVFHLLILSSRTVILSVFGAAFIYLVIRAVMDRKMLKYLVLLIGVILIGTSVVYKYRDTLLLNRYSQIFTFYNNQERIYEQRYSVSNRAKVYIIGFSLFKSIEMYGINGTGLSAVTIKQKYDSDFKKVFPFKTETYNSHNQYINNFIDWGLLGVLLMIYLLYRPIKVSFGLKKYWTVVFWMSFAFILSMESFLIRHKGIVFFIIFYSLLNAAPSSHNDEKKFLSGELN